MCIWHGRQGTTTRQEVVEWHSELQNSSWRSPGVNERYVSITEHSPRGCEPPEPVGPLFGVLRAQHNKCVEVMNEWFNGLQRFSCWLSQDILFPETYFLMQPQSTHQMLSSARRRHAIDTLLYSPPVIPSKSFLKDSANERPLSVLIQFSWELGSKEPEQKLAHQLN